MGPLKPWEELTPEEKRVDIARDILQALAAKQYIAWQGIYVVEKFPTATRRDSVKEILELNQGTCEVCMMGAALMSVIRRVNEVTVEQLSTLDMCAGPRDRKIAEEEDKFIGRNKLEEYFDVQQLGLMEAAFEENSAYATLTGVGEEIARQASNYRVVFDDFVDDFDLGPSPISKDTVCMVGICLNLIRNNGTFKPEEVELDKAEVQERGYIVQDSPASQENL